MSKISLLEDRDRFTEECAAEAYGESYFPGEGSANSDVHGQ
jgi:hypothetical protein